MNLYSIRAADMAAVFGTPLAPIQSTMVVVGQSETCDEFILFGDEVNPLFTAVVGYPPHIFTYCQEWGLTFNTDTIAKMKTDLRKKALMSITANTVDANNTPIVLDGDVISPTESRPASAILIKFKLDEIRGTANTAFWKDKSNNWQTVNAASLETALTAISAATTAIWAKYA